MAKREYTPEQKEVMRQRMANARAARQNKNSKTNDTVDSPKESLSQRSQFDEPVEHNVISSTNDVEELRRQVQELKDMQWKIMSGQFQGAQVGGGKVVGTVDKYSTEAEYSKYPDPRERLAVEPKLQRFAFSLNFELNYEVTAVEYETIDKVRTREPRFNLELIRILLDEDSGQDTGGRYVVARLMMHEDPEAAMVIAREEGITVETEDEISFLNEMRYIRIRDWLLECFYPPKPTEGSARKDTVIDGKLVQFYQKNMEEGHGRHGVPKAEWDKLPRIKF